MTNTLIPFDIESQKQAALKLVDGLNINTLVLAAKNLEVFDDDTYKKAVELRAVFADAEAKVTKFWEPLVKAAHGLHKLMTGARTEMLDRYTPSKDLLTRKAEAFLAERRRAERAAQAAMERAAEESRLALEREAKRLAMRGEMDKAEEVKLQASVTISPTLPRSTPTVAGARTSDKFKGSVPDIMALLATIVNGDFSLMHEVKPGDIRPLVVVDQVVLNALVNRLGDGLNVPGIKVEEVVKLSSTGR